MNAVSECNGVSTSEPKNRTELLTLNKDYILQYKGFCFISIDKLKLSLVIKANDEEELLAPFSRKFIYSKNMLCILGPKKTNDIALFFSKESACKKVYDFLISEKAIINTEYKPIEESVIQQNFNERFMSPLLDAFKNSSNVRLKEIVISMINVPLGNTVKENIPPQSSTNLLAVTTDCVQPEKSSDAILDMKVEPHLPSDPIIMDPIDLSYPHEDPIDMSYLHEVINETYENEADYHHIESMNSDDNDSDYELPAKKRKYSSVKIARKTQWLQSHQFELLNLTQRKLLVFISSDKNFCYDFSWHPKTEAFYCLGCKKMGIYNKAKILKHLNGKIFVEMNESRHKCAAIPYVPYDPREKIVKNDNFELVKKVKNGRSCTALIIFEGNDKQMCRILYYNESRKLYNCAKCQRKSVTVEANFIKKENYVQLGLNDHICDAVQYSSITFDKNKNIIGFSLPKQMPASVLPTVNTSGNFEIRYTIKNGIKKYSLMVFLPDSNRLCYDYHFLDGSKMFWCYRCKRSKKSVWGKLEKITSECYRIQHGETQHACNPLEYSSNVGNQKLLDKFDYDILIENDTNSVNFETPVYTPAEIFGPAD